VAAELAGVPGLPESVAERIAMHTAGLPPRCYGLVMAINGIVIVIVQPLVGTWLGRSDGWRRLAS
jgi:hypothetical protein